MYDLTSFTLKDMTSLGAALRRMGDGAASMEEAANRTVRYLYDHLVDGKGKRASALVRFFITHPYARLERPLQQRIDNIIGHAPADPQQKCFTLLATAGIESAWNRRQSSANYKVYPLTARMIEQYPMFAQVFKEFGIEIDMVVQPDPTLLVHLEQKTYNIFYVPDAVGSPYIPDQDNFVLPYGVRSVLGFFGMLPSGNHFTVILFSRVLAPREATEYFKTLALSVKMAVLPFDNTAVFTTDSLADPTPDQAAAQLRSRAASLNELLTVHEQVVREQSDRITRMVTEAAVSAERNRLARDLHDSVTQALYSQTLYAEAAVRQLDTGKAERAAEHLQQLRQTAQQALREMRLLIFELRPPALAEAGLVAALQARLEAVEARTGVETAVIAPDELQLPPDVETGLYWIAQEALNNALKHAQAAKIGVTLAQTASGVTLTIADDGVGLESAVSPPKGTLGLRGMQERAAQLGWQFSLKSDPGQGTTIHVEVPHE